MDNDDKKALEFYQENYPKLVDKIDGFEEILRALTSLAEGFYMYHESNARVCANCCYYNYNIIKGDYQSLSVDISKGKCGKQWESEPVSITGTCTGWEPEVD